MAVTFDYVDSSRGARICVVSEPGQGTPVLFVVNIMFPCASVLAHYSGNLALHRGLAGGAGWYMFDWRGAGRSTTPTGPVTFTDLVDDIEAVAKAIREPFDLFAVNDGCGMALALAVRRPELVRRLLLIAPQGEHTRAKLLSSPLRRAFLAEPEGVLGQYLTWVHPGTDPDETFAIAKETFEVTPIEHMFVLEQAAATADLFEFAPAVRTPAFLIATAETMLDAVELAGQMPFARAANWTQIGDGTINGAAWRKAWDEMVPPREQPQSAGAHGDPVHGAGLSPREAEILVMVCRGLSNAEIGAALVIAPSTAKRHVANIFAKLGVASRPQAIALAHDRGLIPEPQARRER